MGTESEAAWDQVWNEGGFQKGLLRQFWKKLMAAGTLRAKHRERSVVEVGQGLKGLLENRLVILLIRLVVANDQLQISSEDDGEPLGNSPVFDNSGFTLGAGEGVGLGRERTRL